MSVAHEQMETSALIDAYVEAASAYGTAIAAASDDEANAAHDEIAAIYRELRRRGPDAQNELLPLLGGSEPGVLLWAASHALEFCPDVGAPVLDTLRLEGHGIMRLVAGMTLQQWRSGALSFP